MCKKFADIGVIGLAVMGQNLVINMSEKGFKVAVFNRTFSKVKNFLDTFTTNSDIFGYKYISEMVKSLKKPRKVMIMVRAGETVDQVINKLLPLLEAGDIIIDGGNSNFLDTERRIDSLKNSQILYLGMGISGGEEGARFGPSIMPGGSMEAWGSAKFIFEKISAKTSASERCCKWVGKGGSGHFVKMVHNGIEYGDMQLISESYHILRDILKQSNSEMSEVFSNWNDKTSLSSYLIGITANILKFRDTDNSYLLDKILDSAGQKGTGKWVAANALNLNSPLNLIVESVFSRCISSDNSLRKEACLTYPKSSKDNIILQTKEEFLLDLESALIFAKIISYSQGYMMISKASKFYKWNISLSDLSVTWREGCIIKSTLLDNIREAFLKKYDLTNIIFDRYFSNLLKKTVSGARNIAIIALKNGIPTPTLSSALNFFDAITTTNLPSNLIQAQRDYFGAHTYQRRDKSNDNFFHTDWTGLSGFVSSSNYNI